jgi:hypothetical protein
MYILKLDMVYRYLSVKKSVSDPDFLNTDPYPDPDPDPESPDQDFL